jgi:hypothetical protein
MRPRCLADVHRSYLRLPHSAAGALASTGGMPEVRAAVAKVMRRDDRAPAPWDAGALGEEANSP